MLAMQRSFLAQQQLRIRDRAVDVLHAEGAPPCVRRREPSKALTLRVQLGFVWRELKTGKGPYNPRAYIHLKRVHGANRAAVYRATDVFMYEYENPGVRHQRER